MMFDGCLILQVEYAASNSFFKADNKVRKKFKDVTLKEQFIVVIL